MKGLGRIYSGDHGHEKPGAGSGKMVILKTVVVILQYRVREVGLP